MLSLAYFMLVLGPIINDAGWNLVFAETQEKWSKKQHAIHTVVKHPTTLSHSQNQSVGY